MTLPAPGRGGEPGPRLAFAAAVAAALSAATLGVALRCHGLDRSLWYDEVFTAERVLDRPIWKIPSTQKEANNHVLFSVAAKASTAMVSADAAPASPRYRVMLRLPAVLAGIAGVLVVALAARAVAGDGAGAGAALLAALSPMHVELSRQARGYSLLVLFATVALLGWARVAGDPAEPGGARRGPALTVLGCGLAAWSHPLGVLVAAALLLDAVVVVRSRRAVAVAAGALVASVVAVAPIATRLWRFAGRNTGVESVASGPGFLIDLSAELLVGAGGGVVGAVGLVALVGLIVGGVALALGPNGRRDAPALGAVARPLLWQAALIAALVVLFRPRLGVAIGEGEQHYHRFFVALQPGLWVLGGAGLAALARLGGRGQRAAAWTCAAALVIVIVVPMEMQNRERAGRPEQDLTGAIAAARALRAAAAEPVASAPIVAVGTEAWIVESLGAAPDLGQRPAVCVAPFAGTEPDAVRLGEETVAGRAWNVRVYLRPAPGRDDGDGGGDDDDEDGRQR